jgi:Fe2+ transport system protein FeoA
MTLWDSAPRTFVTITGFDSSLPEKFRIRLMDLGFDIGSRVHCVRHVPFSGPRVYQMNDATFALEKEVAQLVSAEPESEVE